VSGFTRNYALILAALAFAFLLRVAGQAVVAVCQVDFLPPMEQWYSGLVPYPVLFPTQIVILVVQVWICYDLWRGTGIFVKRNAKTGRVLRWFAYLYFTVMLLRYVLVMSFYPEQRWFSGTIPIFFHWVLAAYLFVLGHYHARTATASKADLR